MVQQKCWILRSNIEVSDDYVYRNISEFEISHLPIPHRDDVRELKASLGNIFDSVGISVAYQLVNRSIEIDSMGLSTESRL